MVITGVKVRFKSPPPSSTSWDSSSSYNKVTSHRALQIRPTGNDPKGHSSQSAAHSNERARALFNPRLYLCARARSRSSFRSNRFDEEDTPEQPLRGSTLLCTPSLTSADGGRTQEAEQGSLIGLWGCCCFPPPLFSHCFYIFFTMKMWIALVLAALAAGASAQSCE